jgi:nitroimidazol reductase NimA-like FMN-containing flavoprotein (pyridoxamine 5'-phosphate oxidase superfamily)
MRRKDKEITDPAIIESILGGSLICRIAISGENGPYLVPLNYGYRNKALYFHSARHGRKIEMLSANSRVCFEIESDYEIIKKEKSCGWTTRYRSLIGYGHVKIITDENLIREGLDIIMCQHGKTDNQYEPEYLSRIAILKLDIEQVSGKQSGDWE